MLKAIVDFIRRKNRARLERRHLVKANPQLAGGWLDRLRARNHDRLARRRARRDLLSSLAANDTAVLEALVFLLKSARQEQQARTAADEALQARLAALDAKLGEGAQLVAARLQTLELKLGAARRGANEVIDEASLAPRAAAGGGSNGEVLRASTPPEGGAKRAEPAAGPEAGNGRRRS